MIIKCEKCQTGFEVDKNIIIRLMGAKVRCLGCSSEFNIYPPVYVRKIPVSPEKTEQKISESPAPVLTPESDKKEPHLISSQTDAKSSVKLRLVLSALVLLVLALGFNALLSLSSLEKLYVESIVSKYSIIAKDLERNIENSLRFGKSIEKFVGMDQLLNQTKKNLTRKIKVEERGIREENLEIISESDIVISVSMPDGLILYSTDNQLINTILPQHALSKYKNRESRKKDALENHYLKYKDTYHITLPVWNSFKKTSDSTVIIAFNEKPVKNLLNSVLIKNIRLILIILLCGILLLIITLNFVTPGASSGRRFPKLKISLIMFFVIGFSQLIFTGLNTNEFKNYYMQISKEKTAVLTVLLKEDIEYLISKGLNIDKLFKLDVMMGEIVAAAPELDNITITDTTGEPLYTATSKGVFDCRKITDEEKMYLKEITGVKEPEYNFFLKILKDEKVKGFISASSYHGFISTNISKKVLFARLKEIALDSATILVISFLFFAELLIILFQFVEKQFVTYGKDIKNNYMAVRPAAFIFLFAAFISSSFLPLHTANLYKEPIFGLSKEFVLGLPISSEMLFVGIAVIIAGILIDRKGWHVAFFIGIFFSMSGIFLSGIAGSVIEFIIYRGIMGFGYGLTWLSFQGYVFENTDQNQRAKGISNLVAGIFSGSICGGAVGGMLAERIGYEPVFFLGAGIMLITLFFVIIFMRSTFLTPRHNIKEEKKSFNAMLLFKFIFNRNIFLLLTCCSIPNTLCFVGVMYYLTPIYLNSIETSQSNIARALMLYGLCMIYIAPVFSRLIDRSDNKRIYISFSGFIAGLGLLSFYISDGFTANLLIIFMLSLSNCLGLTSRVVFALNTKVANDVGKGMSLGIYHALERIGQVSGPLVVALAVSLSNVKNGTILIGVAYLVMTLFFLFSIKSEETS